MDIDEFRSILTAFADKPANVNVERGELMVEIRDDLIQGSVSQRVDGLWVEENGDRQPADDWIFKRIARLPILAERILSYVPEEPHFIEPAGEKLDRIHRSPDDSVTSVDPVTEPILELLNERPAGMSTGVYLTCDAGEGKTTLINQLARQQAQRFKEKSTDWLLVPIALGGRPFLRFDDVFTGTLVNRLRFPFFYYDALVWLVRKGAIVPALDGFEEMFVESQAGDAVTALGNLMNLLDSRGTILIAARSAYFEYKDLRTQAPLFDSFQGQSADFARIHLSRWDRDRFVRYAEKRKIPSGSELFTQVADKLHDESHPLLTRPVLVRRLMDVASDRAGRDDLIENIGGDRELHFERFVESIIRREAREKWIGRSGMVAQPLLSERQHCDLLAGIAAEMWLSETAMLPSDVFDYVADLFVEDERMDAQVTKQIHQRIRQHALMTAAERGTSFGFDHEAFYHYFLGESVARLVGRSDIPELRRVFRIARFPTSTVDVAKRRLIRDGYALPDIVATFNSACRPEPYASFVKDNAGSLLVRLLGSVHHDGIVAKRMSFPANSLSDIRVSGACFHDCYFQRTELAGSIIDDCVFERCQFEQLDLSEVKQIERSRLLECEVFAVVRSKEGSAIFDPMVIVRALRQAGFDVSMPPSDVADEAAEMVEPEVRLVLTERMCRAFFRSTGVNENTFRQRMGKDWTVFSRQVLPALQTCSVIVKADYKGSGSQQRYRLGVSLLAVQQSIERANGSFDTFVESFRG